MINRSEPKWSTANSAAVVGKQGYVLPRRTNRMPLHGLPFTILLAAIAWVGASHDSFGQTQPFQPTYEDGIARRGQDYRSFRPIGPSALYCQQACLTEPQCRAWSYDSTVVRRDGQPMCWLKNGIPAQAKANGIISGVVRPETDGTPKQAPAAANTTAPPPANVSTSAPPSFAYRRSVRPGIETPLAYERYWDANCQARPLQVIVTQPPANGSMWVIQTTSTIPTSTPRGGSTGACAGKSVLGNQVFYQSNAGFQGTDTAAYSLTYDDGRQQSVTVSIDVREASAAPATPQRADQSKVLSCTVISGQEARCTSHMRLDGQRHERTVSIDVTTPPAHGKVVTRIVDEVAKFNDGQSQNAHATAIFYQSNPGFAGQDIFSYQRHSDDAGDPLNGPYTMNVTVR